MMATSIDELNGILGRIEDCNIEFKAARRSFERRHDLADYCAALANEGGGKLLLGVKERADSTGEVVGTSAFLGTHNKLSNELLTELKIRVDVEEIAHAAGRVLVFHVPSRPTGSVVRSTGRYKMPMRAGESLREMDDITLRSIMNENAPDFSMSLCPSLNVGDLDELALEVFKHMWAQKARRDDYLYFANDKMLRSVGVLTDDGLNNTALVLFARPEILDERLPDAEIIFEWRRSSTSVSHDYRSSWRAPFFAVYNKIWDTINARNSRMPFQQGFIQREILAFDEKPIREAVLNAVAHRDYTVRGQSIFIRTSPDAFSISSPGGFPPGITTENILYKCHWRNRRIAEVFEKAGLVERSGQGMDDIFQSTIRDGKGRPDLSQSDDHCVVLSIPARLRDKDFVLFLETITNERQISFSFEEMLELENIRENQVVERPESCKRFLELGIVERIGRGRGTRYILSHRYYAHRGKTGTHTRISGIHREKQKELILHHLARNKKGYRRDIQDIFPELKPMDVSNLLRELKNDGRIRHFGSRKLGYWELA